MGRKFFPNNNLIEKNFYPVKNYRQKVLPKKIRPKLMKKILPAWNFISPTFRAMPKNFTGKNLPRENFCKILLLFYYTFSRLARKIALKCRLLSNFLAFRGPKFWRGKFWPKKFLGENFSPLKIFFLPANSKILLT